MLVKLRNWLDHRTGYRSLMSALMIEHVPGGARWRYVWGSCLAFVFAIQLITGLLLMTAYSPGDNTAWASVYYIQYEMDFGWLIRGLHHFGSQTMVVLLGLHMLQVVIAGAHLPPREINWWLGLMLLGAVLALSLTGYLLPWDQKGFWATQVATNIAGHLPLVGPWLQKVIVGGSAYGHHTLTRFYALHVGILPAAVIGLTILHLTVFRRHGVTTPKGATGEGWFWPDQAFRDMVVSLAIFGAMIGLVMAGHAHKIEAPEGASGSTYERWAHAGRDGLGANLDAPADAAQPYPARPEWYFMFLFQVLKYFEGSEEIIGTVVIPNGVLVLLALLPLLGYGRMRRFGHGVGIVVVTGILVGAATLTCLGLADDSVDPVERWLLKRIAVILLPVIGAVLLGQIGMLALVGRGRFRRAVFVAGVGLLAVLIGGTGSLLYGVVSHRVTPAVNEWVGAQLKDRKVPDSATKFQSEVEKAEQAAGRAIELARQGVPASGAVNLLRQDPLTRGKPLFGEHCAGCHNHGKDFESPKASASDLAGFGTYGYVLRLLTNPGNKDFFGRMQPERTTMQDFIDEQFPSVALPPAEVAKLGAAAQKELEKNRADLNVLAAWLARHPRRTSPDRDSEEFKQGYKVFVDRQCSGCHAYEDIGGKRSSSGPDLTGYGDAQWLRLMIMAPAHSKRYGLTNTMPAFRDLDGPAGAVVKEELNQIKDLLLRGNKKLQPEDIEKAHRVVHLNDLDRELILRWILRDGRLVFGGEPIIVTEK